MIRTDIVTNYLLLDYPGFVDYVPSTGYMRNV